MVYELNAKMREVFGKKLAASRQEGLVPAVIYGTELEKNVNVFLNLSEFLKVYHKASGSSLINLKIEGESKPHEVLVKEVSMDPVKGTALHIDFYQIKHGQKLEVEVGINFVGLAPAVKVLGGILIKNLNTIKIKCLPEEILSDINVDLSKLVTFEDRIHVKDLNIPSTIEVLHDMEDVVISVSAPTDEDFSAPAKVEAVATPAAGEAAAPAAAGAKAPAAKAPAAKEKKK